MTVSNWTPLKYETLKWENKDELEYFFKQLCSMNVSVVELSAMYNEYITNNHKQDIQ